MFQLDDDRASQVSVLRLNMLRAYYALIALGTALVFWPDLLAHSHEWGIRNGAQYSLLGAVTPFALIGLRYPLTMLPIILYEFVWKALWFLFVAAPLYAAGQMTDMVWSNAVACAVAIVLTPVVVPWRYISQTYLSAPADKWRPHRA